MTTHEVLLVHAAATLVLAGVMWGIQVGVVPRIRQASVETWPRHADTYRRVLRTVFWPLVGVEAASGILVTWRHPAGIPSWVHGVNVALLIAAWCVIPLTRFLVGHHPLDRFDPAGFGRFARLNWVRVVVWTARGVVVLAMLRLAAVARAG